MHNGLVSSTAPNTTQPHQSNLLKDWEDNKSHGFFETVFMVKVGDAITTKKEQLLYRTSGPELKTTSNSLGNVINPSEGGTIPQIETIASQPATYGLIYYTRGLCRDTTLGGNDALNCYWQYNENDDIAHPFTITQGDTTKRDIGRVGNIGMGRVYAETINSIQSILYLGFGIPEFNNLSAWSDNFYKAPYGEAITTSMWFKWVDVLTEATKVPLRALRAAAQYYRLQYGGQVDAPVTNFFAFRSQMPLYFGQVQSLLVILATNMQLMYGINPIGDESEPNAVQIQNEMNQMSQGQGGIPDYISHLNINFVQIMARRFFYESGDLDKLKHFDKTYTFQNILATEGKRQQKTQNQKTPAQGDASNSSLFNNKSISSVLSLKQKVGGWTTWKGLHSAFIGGSGALRNETLFIGFRVERGNNSSESLSSSTQPSTVQQALDALLGPSKAYTQAGAGQSMSLADNLASALANAQGVMAKIKSKVGSIFGVGVAAAIGAGVSMADIPEVWSDSQFSKSYSFNLQLIAPYGDPITILQTLYIPLCCLLAGSAPRCTGLSSYTSPFLCRAYCRGKFAIPMGIIDSLSIDRGSSSHGWTHGQLPRTIDLSFSIKDLTPNMPLTLITNDMSALKLSTKLLTKPIQAAEYAINYVTRAETTLNQYLMTLAGFGPHEFLIPYLQYQNKLKQLLGIKSDVMFSPLLSGMGMGSGVLNKAYSLYKSFLPTIPKQEVAGGSIG